MIQTVQGEHSEKLHIVNDDSDDDWAEYPTFCGHVHFDVEGPEVQTIDEIKDLCENCRRGYIGL